MQDILSTATVLTTPAPPVSPDDACAIALEHYAIRATARLLPGERDSNFHLTAHDGREYLLKLANPAEDICIADFQTSALMHIAARTPDLAVPRVVWTVRNEAFFSLGIHHAKPRTARMLTYLQGTPLAEAGRSTAQRRALAAGLAQLDLALADYRHPAESQELLWDLSHAARLRPMLACIADDERRALASQALDRLEKQIFPAQLHLRRQVIHNDFNPSNILVGMAENGHMDRLAGIIDFGDMVHAPLVNELAVAASYHVSANGPFLEPILEFAGAYHAVLPLEDAEIACLFDLVRARMMLTVVISAWRATLEPDNRDYILRNAGRAWLGLERSALLSPDEATDRLRSHLQETGTR